MSLKPAVALRRPSRTLIGAPWWLAGGPMAAPLLVAELGSDWSLLIVVPIALAGGFAGDYLRRLARRA